MDIVGYHKIPGPFKRHVEGPDKNKLIPWDWTSEELRLLSEVPWKFTEKIDGTNIRIIWDGYKPEFRGRTDNAQFPPGLIEILTQMFPEELFEQTFGSTPAILFGEGYGPGIQKGGGNYRKDKSFILFDVLIGQWWLKREDVRDVAKSFGIETVPNRLGNLYSVTTLREGIVRMARHPLYSFVSPDNEEFIAEGLIAVPAVPLLRRDGSRIIVKLKGCDLYGLDL